MCYSHWSATLNTRADVEVQTAEWGMSHCSPQRLVMGKSQAQQL